MTKLYLTGGYLGSGKTTAICGACEMLIASGKRVAVISNDQGGRLVDGSLVKQLGFSAREVTGGCFCCRFEALETAISSLRDSDLPEYIFAESVGSCTDIVATVVKPLQRSYPDLSVILTVFSGCPFAGERGKWTSALPGCGFKLYLLQTAGRG